MAFPVGAAQSSTPAAKLAVRTAASCRRYAGRRDDGPGDGAPIGSETTQPDADLIARSGGWPD